MSKTLPTPRVDISQTQDDLELAAADAVLATITEALHDRGRCLIALSGGHTPRGVYRHLGNFVVARSMDVRGVHLIFGDERMVPQNDPASNFGMVQRELLSRVGAPPLHVFRIKGELSPDDAAHEYERELQGVLSLFAGRCDLVLLGVGEDGHTASLFPGNGALHESQRTVRSVFVQHLDRWRVTLTLPVINRSRAVIFLATGEQKAGIVRTIVASTHPREDIPATMVRPDAGTVRWMLDATAASRIPPAWTVRGMDPEDEHDTP